MSKLVTTRYEYAAYDDSSGALTQLPPVYPPTLDQYSTTTVATSTSAYGVTNVTYTVAANNNTLATVPVGATLLILSPTSNTQVVTVRTGTYVFAVMPGQIISIPSSLNATGTLQCDTVADASYTVVKANFTLQICWSW